ncbi:histidine kinase [Cupriavidus sp. DL-D2]|uniref:sensor histidine kinase n=1 Tax=Cupriavidus sp. DL-D2 TaxID=3144974 RepID=UPI003213AF76
MTGKKRGMGPRCSIGAARATAWPVSTPVNGTISARGLPVPCTCRPRPSRRGRSALPYGTLQCPRCARPARANSGHPTRHTEDIARALHDGPAQLLAFALMQLDRATQSPGDGGEAALRHARQLVKDALQTTRGVIGGLQQMAQSNFPALPRPLAHQCIELAAEVARMTGCAIDTDCPTLATLPPPLVCEQLMRAARELLLNACKHAPGAHVCLGLRETADYPPGIALTVSDNGPGFDPDLACTPMRGHNGLRDLPSRLAAIGARLRLDARTGAGVHACIEWWPTSHSERRAEPRSEFRAECTCPVLSP